MPNEWQHLPAGCTPGPFEHVQGCTPADKVAILSEYAQRYELRTMVETGLYCGGGSGMALLDAGMITRYIAIDWQDENIRLARERYPAVDGYPLFLRGDSAINLPLVVVSLEDPALFWLDAHGIPSDVDFPPCPLWAELEALAVAEPAHVILIDDLHMMGSHDWPTLADLRGYIDRVGRWQREEADNIMRLTPMADASVSARVAS